MGVVYLHSFHNYNLSLPLLLLRSIAADMITSHRILSPFLSNSSTTPSFPQISIQDLLVGKQRVGEKKGAAPF